MSAHIVSNPLHDERGMSLTFAHLIIFALTGLSLLLGQLDLPPGIDRSVGQFRRAMFLLLGMAVMYYLTTTRLKEYQKRLRDRNEAEINAANDQILRETKFDKNKNSTEWDNVSAHPSRFLTTRDGKPRLFPFPLGKAGGQGLRGELWWEAGNSSHVGHFNQKETPEARQKLRWDLEDKEAERLKKAMDVRQAYDEHRKKWIKRLSNLKLVAAVIVLALVSRAAAVVALGALIYYVLITELSEIMAKEPEMKPKRASKKKKLPNAPGMAMTYLYEPDDLGNVEPATSIPVSAPSNRLMTSTSNKLAS